MSQKYTPILKWKLGEQNAIHNLDESIKNQIIPLFEVSANVKSLDKFSTGIEKYWKHRPYYFYLSSEWFDNELDIDSEDPFAFGEYVLETYSSFKKSLDSYAIPVFDLSNTFCIENWQKQNDNKFVIRIQGSEFGLIEQTLNPIQQKIELSQIDLLLDLRILDDDNEFAKQAVIKAAISDLDNPGRYRSIMIASNSFPSNFAHSEQGKLVELPRRELSIHLLGIKLASKFEFNYIYADYGPTDLSDTVFIIGMNPNFKIKYSDLENYYYLKGLPIKRGGLDYENVKEVCKTLTQCENIFPGANFCWADKKIFEIAMSNRPIKVGNLTTWVSYSFNHHITLITKKQ